MQNNATHCKSMKYNANAKENPFVVVHNGSSSVETLQMIPNTIQLGKTKQIGDHFRGENPTEYLDFQVLLEKIKTNKVSEIYIDGQMLEGKLLNSNQHFKSIGSDSNEGLQELLILHEVPHSFKKLTASHQYKKDGDMRLNNGDSEE